LPAMEREAVLKYRTQFQSKGMHALVYDCCAADRGQARSYIDRVCCATARRRRRGGISHRAQALSHPLLTATIKNTPNTAR
jgi:hypothetical protein